MAREVKDEDMERELLEKQVERKILEIHGLVDKEQKETRDVLSPIICWKCKTKNGATAQYCDRCGAYLDEEKMCKDMIALGEQLIKIGRQAARNRLGVLKQKIL